MRFLLPIFFVMSLFVHNSAQWNQRQRGFINIPADFSFGSDSAYNIPDTSPSGTFPQTTPQTVTVQTTTPFTTQKPVYSSQTPVTTVRTSSSSENLIYGVKFDCSGKPTGFYKDPKYCDLFHVCVGNQQKKTYPCPQVGGDKFYYDETLRRCEAALNNPNGCASNSYYQTVSQDPTAPATTQAPVEAWKQYVRKNDPFTCAGKSDGFYASRWCNVFYRCYIGFKFEFLCAKQRNGDRLWWTQHSSSQQVAQQSAQCGFPCELNRACSSPGGVLIDNVSSVSDSTTESARIFNSCSTGSTASSNNDTSNSADDFFRLPETDSSCSGLPDGTFLTDNKYCNIFHVCLAGKRKDFLCAKAVTNQYELWWNDATKTCEWPCKVKCNKQIYGTGGRTATDIQTLDKGLNGAECDSTNYYVRRWYGHGK